MNHLNPPILSRFEPIPTTSPLAAALVAAVKGLCDAIGERASRRFIPPLIGTLLWGRLRRLAVRFETLIARHRAGTLRPPRRRPRRPRERPAPDPAPGAGLRPHPHPWSGLRPSRAFGWLARDVPEARIPAGFLERWLAEPEVAALLQAAPHAARPLRPLCHMLGIRPDPAVIPPLPRRPRRKPPEPEAAEPADPAAPPPPTAAERRAQARAEAREEARWAAAYRRSLGLPSRKPRD